MNMYITKKARELQAQIEKNTLLAPKKNMSLDDGSSSELVEAARRIFQFAKDGAQPAKKKLLECLVIAKKIVLAAWNSKAAFIIKHFSVLEHLVLITGILSVSFFIVVQLFWNNWVKTDETFELAYRFAVLDFIAILTFCILNIIRCWEPEVKSKPENVGYDDSIYYDYDSDSSTEPSQSCES